MKENKVSHIFISTLHRNAHRAPETSDMLERTPSKLLRMGGLAIIMLLGLLVFIGVFIRYPDTLEGGATITTYPLPIKLKTQSGGRINALMVTDGTVVPKNTVIAEIENPTGYENISKLEHSIDDVNKNLRESNDGLMAALLAHPLQSLGDAQPFYNQLLQQISSKLLLQKEQLYSKRTSNLQQQIGKLASMTKITEQQKTMTEEELKQAEERFVANEKLYKDKIISKQEYYDEAAKLRQKKIQLEQQNSAIIQNNVTAGENNKQMLDMQYERQEKERGLTIGIEEALRNLTNYIQTWKQRYLVVAPYAGTVQYLRPLQVNEPANAGEELFAIVPSEHKYVAVVMLPSAGIGKVAVGQKVHLLLDNFPYNEFGFVEGTISKRGSLPEAQKGAAAGQTMYRVYVQLKDSLETNYHKPIPFSPEMTATARIITHDRNLLQRLVAGIAKNDK